MSRYLLPICLFLLIPFLLHSQAGELSDPEPYFMAIIVSNIDTSLNWYTSQLGFEVVDRIDAPENGFRQANLKRGKAAIELIELQTTIYPAEILEGKPSRSRIAGFFKFGFTVSDFDAWVDQLNESGVAFHGRVVQNTTGKKMVIIQDPDGNRIQIFKR